MGLQVILGIVSRCLQTVSSSSSGKSILTVKRIHMILGIILDLAAKFSIFTGWYPNNINVFIALLVVEGLFLLAHIIFYVAAPSLTNKGFDSQI